MGSVWSMVWDSVCLESSYIYFQLFHRLLFSKCFSLRAIASLLKSRELVCIVGMLVSVLGCFLLLVVPLFNVLLLLCALFCCDVLWFSV